MGQALYRKYRSKSFDEVVGQDHVVKTLTNALKNGKISHAYLFTGPKGVGKTSVARILAREVNSLPSDAENIHLDIIEIDAASNRRIDEIRDLRERVRVAPTSAKYKVYIIDEVHMLTREAFNALLKTLEEPPAHCIFILATTEAHKLPETIISRTQRFDFKPVSAAEVASHLKTVAKAEKINIDSAALELLAEFGEGSVRDSLGYLDQLGGSGQPVTAEDVRSLLGLPPTKAIDDLHAGLLNSDGPAVLGRLEALNQQGISPSAVAAFLAKRLRQDWLAGQAGPLTAGLLKELIEVPASRRPQDSLEIALLGACAGGNAPAKTTTAATGGQESKVNRIETAAKPPAANKPPKAAKSQPRPFDEAAWAVILDKTKAQAASLYTALRLAQPAYSDDKLMLNFKFALHQKKINAPKNKQLIEQLIEEVCGRPVEIECLVDKSAKTTLAEPAETAAPASHNPLQAINNIFGAAEMLES